MLKNTIPFTIIYRHVGGYYLRGGISFIVGLLIVYMIYATYYLTVVLLVSDSDDKAPLFISRKCPKDVS